MLKSRMLFLAAVLVCAFAPAAVAQTIPDAAGVTVDLNGAPLMHRSSVMYPHEAIANGVQGTVVVQVKLSATGEVDDASILSGPDELRKAVLQSVLNWHFAHDVANSTRQVNITFELPKPGTETQTRSGVLGGIVGSVPRGTMMYENAPSRIKAIRINGLSEAAQNDLLAQLPVHEGDTLTPDTFTKLQTAVRGFDEHLGISMNRSSDGETTIGITAPGAYTTTVMSPMPAMVLPPGTVNVGGSTQQSKLTSQTPPSYPPLAKQARIQGVVHLQALIGADGRVQNLQVVSGHPLLVQAALDAVKTWTYQPTLVNGNPVPVKTDIDVNFTLSQ